MFIDISQKELKKYRKAIQVGKVMFDIEKAQDGGYIVKSQHDRLKKYNVYHNKFDKWSCTCTHSSLYPLLENCVHIDATKEYEKILGEFLH